VLIKATICMGQKDHRDYPPYSTAGFKRVFIAPDELLEARRRRSLDRLVKKDTAQSKQVFEMLLLMM